MSKLRKKLAERNRINVVSGAAIPGMSYRRAGVTSTGRELFQQIVPQVSRPITKRDNGRQFSN